MRDFNKNKGIEDADGYSDYAGEIFTNFLQGFTKENKLIIEATQEHYDDGLDEDCMFIYSTRGQKLAEKMLSKLHEIGELHFPNDDIEIYSSLYQEY